MQLSCIVYYYMKNNEKVAITLRNRGLRTTPFRLAIIKAMSRIPSPLSPQQLLSLLEGRPHKTTIYRETETLVRAGLLRSVDAGDGIRRYESATRKHHHHAICTNCRSIKEIPASSCLQELRSARRIGFSIQDHDVQVFGLCPNCK